NLCLSKKVNSTPRPDGSSGPLEKGDTAKLIGSALGDWEPGNASCMLGSFSSSTSSRSCRAELALLAHIRSEIRLPRAEEDSPQDRKTHSNASANTFIQHLAP